MEQSTETGDVSIHSLGGLNQRVSPLNLDQGEFSVLQGYYPSQQGLLSRLPGKKKLFQLEGKVMSIHPTYNSKGHVLIQTDEHLYVSTIDEIQGRSVETDLTANPDADEGGGGGDVTPTAQEIIFSYRTAAGVDAIVYSIAGVTSQQVPITNVSIPIGTTSFILSQTFLTITIPAGTYSYELLCAHYNSVSGIKFSSYLSSSGSSGTNSNTVVSNGTNNTFSRSAGFLNNADVTTLSIRSNTSNGLNGKMGKAGNLGEAEVYMILKIRKIT